MLLPCRLAQVTRQAQAALHADHADLLATAHEQGLLFQSGRDAHLKTSAGGEAGPGDGTLELFDSWQDCSASEGLPGSGEVGSLSCVLVPLAWLLQSVSTAGRLQKVPVSLITARTSSS